MSPFIETILAEFGIPQNLFFHQARLNKTIAHFNGVPGIDIEQALKGVTIGTAPKTKVRLSYNEEGILEIAQEAYTKKEINSIRLVDIGNREYDFKYADRKWIYTLLAEAGTDEIIMVKNGLITDSSIANLAFFDGEHWFTPSSPLLKGTRRAALLEQQTIKPISIQAASLQDFISFKCVNAMMGWEDSPALDINLISG